MQQVNLIGCFQSRGSKFCHGSDREVFNSHPATCQADSACCQLSPCIRLSVRWLPRCRVTNQSFFASQLPFARVFCQFVVLHKSLFSSLWLLLANQLFINFGLRYCTYIIVHIVRLLQYDYKSMGGTFDVAHASHFKSV